MTSPQLVQGNIISEGEVLGQPIRSYARKLPNGGSVVVDVATDCPTAKLCEISVCSDTNNIAAISTDGSAPGLPIPPGGIDDSGAASLIFMVGGSQSTIPVNQVGTLTLQVQLTALVSLVFWD